MGRDRTWIQQAMILTINNLAGLAMGAATGLKNVTEKYKGECIGNMNRSTCSHFYITQPQPNPTSIIAASNGALSEDWLFMFPLLVTYQDSWMFHAAVNRNPEIEADWDEDSCREYRCRDNSSRMKLKICAKEIPLEDGAWGLLVGTYYPNVLTDHRTHMSVERTFQRAESGREG